MVGIFGRVKTLAAVGAVAVGTMGASALPFSSARAGDLSIGMTTWVGYGPLFLARDKGFFKENGVNVDLQLIEEGSLTMAAMASGKMNGDASTIDEQMKYRSKDFCFKVVMALDESHGGDGMVAIDSVKTLKDLKGKNVALNEGSVSQFWFNYLLRKEGMTEKDVTIQNLTADDAAAAFIAGKVPVAVTWEPNLTLVKTKKIGKVLVDSSSTPGVIVDVLSLTCDTIAKQPKDVAGFIKAVYKAVEYTKAHQDESYKIMAKSIGGYLEKPEDFADAAKGVKFYDKAGNLSYFGSAAKPGQVSDLLKLGADVWGGIGKLKTTIDYPTMIDATFLDQ